MRNKCSQITTDAIKTFSKTAIQKTAEETGDWIDFKKVLKKELHSQNENEI